MAGPLIGRRPVLAGLAAAPLLMAQRSPDDRPVQSFLGIRYGRAERFRAPRPELRSTRLRGLRPASPQRARSGMAAARIACS